MIISFDFRRTLQYTYRKSARQKPPKKLTDESQILIVRRIITGGCVDETKISVKNTFLLGLLMHLNDDVVGIDLTYKSPVVSNPISSGALHS